jgi:hypothetical protein
MCQIHPTRAALMGYSAINATNPEAQLDNVEPSCGLTASSSNVQSEPKKRRMQLNLSAPVYENNPRNPNKLSANQAHPSFARASSSELTFVGNVLSSGTSSPVLPASHPLPRGDIHETAKGASDNKDLEFCLPPPQGPPGLFFNLPLPSSKGKRGIKVKKDYISGNLATTKCSDSKHDDIGAQDRPINVPDTQLNAETSYSDSTATLGDIMGFAGFGGSLKRK